MCNANGYAVMQLLLVDTVTQPWRTKKCSNHGNKAATATCNVYGNAVILCYCCWWIQSCGNHGRRNAVTMETKGLYINVQCLSLCCYSVLLVVDTVTPWRQTNKPWKQSGCIATCNAHDYSVILCCCCSWIQPLGGQGRRNAVTTGYTLLSRTKKRCNDRLHSVTTDVKAVTVEYILSQVETLWSWTTKDSRTDVTIW